ncbi:MAG TPA: class I SAM-dependent methyltransferase [Acidimicrobiia bacterium]|nr:class I SAM-dependent methyltransferase [Acidimicrobiia bacterium]
MDGREGYDAAAYGDRIADVYDELPTHPPDADAAAACLADLAGSGPALELAIGTGRLALPLAERGVAVSGIDASEAMVAKLRAKPGGDRIPVAIGDFADVPVDGRFALICVVYNTFFALLDRDAQRRCFERVVDHLAPGGRFVIEAFVPDPSRFERGQHVEVRHIGVDFVLLSVSRHDAATQRVESLLVRLGNDSIRTWPVRIRYSYPDELDVMAEEAGLQLERRWDGWTRERFTTQSVKHVSVYVAAERG